MRNLVWLIRFAALYNLSGALIFVIPGGLGLFGVPAPPSLLWTWLPALMGCFAAVVLLLSARDLHTYGAFPYWNGLVRLSFVIAAFALDFAATAGGFITWLALGDLVLAAACLLGLPAVLQRSHLDLLLNRHPEFKRGTEHANIPPD